MRKTIPAFALILALLILPCSALADGGLFMPDYVSRVYEPSQKAAITWDSGTGLETITLSTRITMDKPESVGWVIPIQSSVKPQVTAGDIDVFYDITNLLETPNRANTVGFGA
jgi:hypothetical protein